VASSLTLMDVSLPYHAKNGHDGRERGIMKFKRGFYRGQMWACTQRLFILSSIVASSIDAFSMVERHNDKHYPMTNGLAKGPAP
jgi:hypothetical protein